jgi:head-tail adaptor
VYFQGGFREDERCFARDALVCAHAGIEFVTGRAVWPSDREIAERESWIWFRGQGPASSGVEKDDTESEE